MSQEDAVAEIVEIKTVSKSASSKPKRVFPPKKDPLKPAIAASKRAGLTFPVRRHETYLAKNSSLRVGKRTGVFFAGAMESLAKQFLYKARDELDDDKRVQKAQLGAKNREKEGKRPLAIRITPQVLYQSASKDVNGLNKIINGATLFASSGMSWAARPLTREQRKRDREEAKRIQAKIAEEKEQRDIRAHNKSKTKRKRQGEEVVKPKKKRTRSVKKQDKSERKERKEEAESDGEETEAPKKRKARDGDESSKENEE